jgi:hypothetical protein
MSTAATICVLLRCWLEVSIYPEVPAHGQLDQFSSAVSVGSRANAKLVIKIHIALFAHKNTYIMQPSKHKIQLKC